MASSGGAQPYGPARRASADLTNQLSALLDSEQNKFAIDKLGLFEDLSPDEILATTLNPCSTGNNTSLPPPHKISVLNHSTSVEIGYRTIGFGQCGLVFERPGRNHVLKIAKPSYEDSLWADFVAHVRVRQAFERQEHVKCRVPRVFSYVTKSNQNWWKQNRPLITEAHHSVSLPAMTLITERILPLPGIARQALIRKYCPPPFQSAARANPTNRDCLARVYLGRRHPADAPPSRNFTLRNYNLCLDQMIELELPVKILATAMGEALAIIHWAAHVDGYDIEFVLGSEGNVAYTRDESLALSLSPEQVVAMQPHTDLESIMTVNFKRRTTRLWVLDFNLCSTWKEEVGWEQPEPLVAQLVMAFFENDPYYPRPLMELDLDKELWEVFSTTYLEKGKQILESPGKVWRLAGLPRMFIDACVARERDNLVKGLGHSHREHKD